MQWLSILLLSIPELLAVPLLVSWSSSVKLIDETDTTNTTSLTPTTSGVIAVDYHYARGEIYFSDGRGRIFRSWLRPIQPPAEPIVIVEVKLCDGLAVDWVHDRLYWTDITRRTLETATLDGIHRKVLFNASFGLHKPRAIALDPNEGLLFWSDWGDKPSLESSGLDGKDKRTVLSKNLDWPNGLTLDLKEQKLYVLDALRATISGCNYDGSDYKTVLRSEETLKQAFGLSLYDKQLYWDSWRTHSIHSRHVAFGSVVTLLRRTGYRMILERMMGLKVVHADLQRVSGLSDPCAVADCSQLCLIGRGRSATCACHYGFQLQADGKTCQEQGYLMISWTQTIRRYTIDGVEEEPMLDSASSATGLDYHYSKQLLFWSDNDSERIYSSPLGQLNNKTAVATVKTCDGLAVDWRHDVLYWTDTQLNTVEAARLDGSDHKVIVSQDLDEPRALALDPIVGLMFWTDWGVSPKIERAQLDGSERHKLVFEGLVWPNGLSLDHERKRLYWVDGKLGNLESIQYDGSGRQMLLESSAVTEQPFALSVLSDHVYWTDWGTLSLYKADLNTMTHAIRLANSSLVLLRPLGMKVIHSELQKQQDNPCLRIQCQGLCLGGNITQQPRCLGQLLTNSTVESNDDSYELSQTVFNDSVQFFTKSSKVLPLAVVKVKCLRRSGCLQDERCVEGRDRTEVFTAKAQFPISGLLPATAYEFWFITTTRSSTFTVSTLENDPPEVPRVTSVEVRGRKALVKWEPVDVCVPHFQHYNYRLIEVQPGGGNVESVVVEGSSNSTEVTLGDLQPGNNYSIQVYTLSPQHFSHINFSLSPGLEELVVYQKNRSAVFFRCDVVNIDRSSLAGFIGIYTDITTDLPRTYYFRREATPCSLWPESFCFNISSLEPDKVYNLSVAAAIASGAVGNKLSLTVTTEEGVAGPPENVTVVKYTPTSVEFQWSHPRESQGIVRGFLISIFELETFEAEKCCQEFPVIEKSALPQEAVYSIEIGDLTPAATYAVSVVARTVYTSSPSTLRVFTPPEPTHIKKQPNVHVSSVQPLTWETDVILPTDIKYNTLIKSYLLIVLMPPRAPRLNTTAHISEPLAAKLKNTFPQEFVVLSNIEEDDSEGLQSQISVSELTSQLKYQLVWVQVSQYKDAFQLDFLKSNVFIAL